MNNDYLALIIVFLLTLNLMVVGAYIVIVLKEVRRTLNKVNQILDNVESFSQSFRKPVINVSTFFKGITKGMEFISEFKKDNKRTSSAEDRDDA